MWLTYLACIYIFTNKTTRLHDFFFQIKPWFRDVKCAYVTLLLKRLEDVSAWLAARLETTSGTRGADSLKHAAVDLEDTEHRSYKPHVTERDFGELATPLGGDADPAEERWDLVAESQPAREARVGQLPHAVDGADTLRLR